MPQTRKLIRSTMRTALADATYGFNAKLAAIATAYSIDAFTLDWSATDSDNFQQSFLDVRAEKLSRLIRDIRAELYTSASAQRESGGERSKNSTFEGRILAHLDITLQFSEGETVTADQTEDLADAIEDVLIQIFLDPAAHYARDLREGPLYYGGGFACSRQPIEQAEDGFSQRLPFIFIFEVHI
jgi:hypothetical protein